MSTNLTVNNNVFAYPDPGDEPGWGEGASGWAAEVTEVLSTVQGTDDIPETSFTILNNIAVPTNITNFNFNPAAVRGAVIEYSIYRNTDINELAEKGTMEIVYKNGGTVGFKWTVGRVFFGDDAGVTITITDAGQGQYVSTNVAGTAYAGVIKFEAKSVLQ